jgi:hypothetical protein
MSRLDDIFNGPVREALGATTTSAHVLAATGGATATVATTGAIVSQIDGITRSRAALSAQSIAPTHDIFGNSNSAVYAVPVGQTIYTVLGVNAAGSIAVVQGTFAGQNLVPSATAGVGALTQAGTSFVGDGSIPSLPDNFAPLGMIKTVTTSATFTPGTTLLNAAGITHTFFDIGLIPSVKP